MKKIPRIHIIILPRKIKFNVFCIYQFDCWFFFSFESLEDNLNICVTTKACSFGKIIVEKIEVKKKKSQTLIKSLFSEYRMVP